MKRRGSVALSVGLSILLVGALTSVAWAAESRVPEGARGEKVSEAASDWQPIGSCEWRVDGDCVVLRPAEGAAVGYLPNEAELPQPYQPDWPWNGNAEIVCFVIEGQVVCGDTACELFRNMPNLKKVEGLDLLDTSRVTNMERMFADCPSLVSLDVSSFDTARVMSMNSMFRGSTSLSSLDLTSFNTSNVIDMGAMLENCSSLFFVDLSSFDTSNVGKMDMFGGCPSLAVVELGAGCTMQSELPDKTWYTANGEAFTPSTMPTGVAVSYATSPELLEPLHVQLSETVLTLRTDAAPFTLEAAVAPAWKVGPLTWSTSDPAVATVDSAGTVTVHNAGHAVISAEIKGVAGTCELTVVPADSGKPDNSDTDNSTENLPSGSGSDGAAGSITGDGAGAGESGSDKRGSRGSSDAGNRNDTGHDGSDSSDAVEADEDASARMNLAQTGDKTAQGVLLLLCDSLALLALLSVLRMSRGRILPRR